MASFFDDALTAEKSPFCHRQMNSGICHAPTEIIGKAKSKGDAEQDLRTILAEGLQTTDKEVQDAECSSV